MTDPLELSIFERLAEPFPAEVVHWRVGATNAKRNNGTPTKGVALAYVDARDVMDRLDTVCGPEGWQDEYLDTGNGATCCRIGVSLDDVWTHPNARWVWKSDGAGKTDYEGEKGQFSDAFKRAAVKFGIGRYLYDLPANWVPLDDRGNISRDALDELNKELAKAGNRHQWGDRNAVTIYRTLKNALRLFCKSPGDVEEFMSQNTGHIAGLRVGAKRELQTEIERLKETLTEKQAA